MEGFNPSRTPMKTNPKLEKSQEAQHLDKPYRELIGCLTYLVVISQPDFSAGSSASFSSVIPVGLADASWVTDINDRHSTSGYLLQVYGSTTGVEVDGPVKIFEDNQSAIAIAESDGLSKEVKHSEVKQSIVT